MKPSHSQSSVSSAAFRSRTTASGIHTVSIVGAGVMGRGIAVANINAGMAVRISDANPAAAADAVEHIRSACHARSPAQRQPDAGGCVRVARSDAEIADADLIIEAIAEDATAKTSLFSRIEPFLRPGALLASNSSSIPIARLSAGLKDPGRFCGTHFCHPVHQRPLVEVIGSEATSALTLARIETYLRTIGMSPVAVRDRPGFLLNRLLVPYLNESLELVLEGVDVETLDRAATEFGLPAGPLRQIDEFGIDVALEVGKLLYRSFPERIIPSELLIAMYKAGRRGCKSGQGFYVDDGMPSATLVPGVRELIAKRSRETAPASYEATSRRLILPMLLEASRALEESVVDNPGIIDVALRDGLGMTKRYRGLLAWAQSPGSSDIRESLRSLEPLGNRFQATPFLYNLLAGELTIPAPRRNAA